MSIIAGGKESALVDLYYTIKHCLIKNKELCPRCKKEPFIHGYYPHDKCYCTHCHLWE